MSDLPTSIERQLKELNPKELTEDFMQRLLGCVADNGHQLDSGQKAIEAGLRKLSPIALSNQLQQALLSKVGDVPFEVDEKVVLFNRSKRENIPEKALWKKGSNLAIAAAVALMGTLAALMLPEGQAPNDLAQQVPPVEQKSDTPLASKDLIEGFEFAPASYSRSLSDARDEGVIWQGNSQPHRVMRLTYTDKVTGKDFAGEKIEVEKPKVEYIILPEKID